LRREAHGILRPKREVQERATFTPPLIRPARSYRPSLLWFRQWNSRQVHGERVNSLAALPRRSRKETNRIGDGVFEGEEKEKEGRKREEKRKRKKES